ncbi:hypothetical protein LG314_10210 [Agrococcus terreus]|uniref:hypothetical protein n=1 Tax=Agrococcus terreus TaxID=574649 RepID=UPI0038502C76
MSAPVSSPVSAPVSALASTRVRIGLLWAGVVLFAVAGSATWATEGEPTALVGIVGYAIVGAIIQGPRSENRVGMLLCALAGLWLLGMLLGLARMLAGAAWAEPVEQALTWPAWVLLVAIGLVFPDGRISTLLGRVLAVALAAFASVTAVLQLLQPGPMAFTGAPNPIGAEPLGAVAEAVLGGPIGLAVLGAIVAGVLVELGLRWRRADGPARLQFRWLLLGLAVAVAANIASTAANALLPPSLLVEALSLTGVALTNAIPAAIGIAVTRHGLYEIGRVVSRSVAFALVTGFAVLVYALAVTSLSWLLPGATALGVAVSTLVAAAVFLPALRWVRRRIERRFDRDRYDAQQVVAAFGAHLRDDPDPASAAGELGAAVDRALQPATVGLWLPGGR